MSPTSSTESKRGLRIQPIAAAAGSLSPAGLPGGKLGALAGLLGRPEGATLAEMMDATGWQAHSVRGALAGALKKRGLIATSQKGDDGVRRYRLPSDTVEGEGA